MFRRNSAQPSEPESRKAGAVVGTGLVLLQRGNQQAARKWFALAGKKTRDPWLLEALTEISFQLGDFAQSQRYSRRRDTRVDPGFSFFTMVDDVNLTASPDKAAKDAGGSPSGPARYAETWRREAGRGDARAMCYTGIYLALTGQQEQARAWLGQASARMAEGPGLIPPSFGLLDADAQLGVLTGLLDPLADGLRTD
jgi:hypothetical protein